MYLPFCNLYSPRHEICVCFSYFLLLYASSVTYLESVDQFFLYGVLSSGICGYTQTFRRLTEPLLLILVLRVGRCSLTEHIRVKKKTGLTDTARDSSEQRSASGLQQPLKTLHRRQTEVFSSVRNITTIV